MNVHSPRDVVSASFFILIDSAPFLWIVRFAVTQIGVGPRFCCLFDFFVFVSTAAGRRRKRWSRCCGRSSMADRLKRKKTETRNEMKHTSFEKRKRHTTTAGGRVRNAADLTSSSPPTQRFHGIAELFFFCLVFFGFFLLLPHPYSIAALCGCVGWVFTGIGAESLPSFASRKKNAVKRRVRNAPNLTSPPFDRGWGWGGGGARQQRPCKGCFYFLPGLVIIFCCCCCLMIIFRRESRSRSPGQSVEQSPDDEG